MTEFSIRLAGKVIHISALYPSTRSFCADYLVEEEEPWLSLSVSQSDIAFEREKSMQEDQLEGLAPRFFPDDYLETLAVYRRIAEGLLPADILLFHGSAVAVDGRACLFTAKSGTGKSTHTRLWRERFGQRAVMVNDDKPLLRFTEEGVMACGTPWSGKHRLDTNIQVPLAGLCILERSETNHIHPVTPREGWPMLLQQSYRPQEPEGLLQTMKLVERLSLTVPLYRLGCNMDPEAVETALSVLRV